MINLSKNNKKASACMINIPMAFCFVLFFGLFAGFAGAGAQSSVVSLLQTAEAAVVVVPPPSGPFRKGLRPPPADQVWVEISGTWTLVPAPPGNGPYTWVEGRWMPDTTPPPPNAEWIPGHWTRRGWIPGHWRTVKAPSVGLVWIAGHWEGLVWIEGYWQGAPSHNRVWVPGHWGPHRLWVPGYWR